MFKIEKPKKCSPRIEAAHQAYIREMDYFEANFDLVVETIAKRMQISPRQFLTMIARTRLMRGRTIVEAVHSFDSIMQTFRPKRKMKDYFEVLFWY